MSVGHGGNNSKHTGLEKLFILEYLEARVQDAVNGYNEEFGEYVSCEVLDPYNTCHDFYILIKTQGKEWFNESYKVYEKIHERYQSNAGGENFNQFIEAWITKLGGKNQFQEFLDKTLGRDIPQLHASSSNTTLFYTIDQVAKFYAIGSRVSPNKIETRRQSAS